MPNQHKAALHPAITHLRTAAVRQRMSVYRLAKLARLDQKTIAMVFDGQVSPTLATIHALAKALGCRFVVYCAKQRDNSRGALGKPKG